MKKLFYVIYAIIFSLCRLFPVKRGRVALLSPHNAGFRDSLGAVEAELNRRGGFDVIRVPRREDGALSFFLKGPYTLARSEYIFLNDNFMPMAYLNFSRNTKIVQLWHAQGVFKRFGLSSKLEKEAEALERRCCKRYDYIVCSSKGVAPYYAEAFAADEKNVLAAGSPGADRYFDSCDLRALREKFDSRYPECRDKKLILYAPTFRDDPERDKLLTENFDFERFEHEFSREYALLLRLHPQIHNDSRAAVGAVDLTEYEDVGELVQLCDLLITDYSSICMDFSLVNKPCVFYAFDLEQYNSERSFFFDYESYVPGRIARSFDELIDVVKSNNFTTEQTEKFRSFNFDYFDNCSAARVIDAVIDSKN